MSSFLDDQAVAERVLQHVRNGTTDRSDTIWHEPVASYRSQERLDAEREVLRRSVVAFCPSASLPDVGSYVAREAAGTSLLAVRGRDRRVRVFRNACRHRGTEVASGSGCAKAFVCPYHGWSYRLDGHLQKITHEDGLPGLDKALHGLVPVECHEALGVVFVQQQGAPPEVAAWDGLPELFAPEQQLIDSYENEIEANWKVHLESFLEGYHIRFAHPETFYPYGFDNLNLLEISGRNSRITFPFRRIEKLEHVPPADRRIDGLVTYVYHLFPNVLVTILSRHTNVVVLEPVSLDRTRIVSYSLTNRGGGAEALQLAQRDASFVNDTGLQEDQALVRSIQRSLGGGANEAFTFGHFEKLIQHFHRTLGAELDAAESDGAASSERR